MTTDQGNAAIAHKAGIEMPDRGDGLHWLKCVDCAGERSAARVDLPGECIASRSWGLYHKRRVNGHVRYYRWFSRWGYRRVPAFVTPWHSRLSAYLAVREANRYLGESDA